MELDTGTLIGIAIASAVVLWINYAIIKAAVKGAIKTDLEKQTQLLAILAVKIGADSRDVDNALNIGFKPAPGRDSVGAQINEILVGKKADA
ncbi:MAG TPA: hypothetical protein VGQ53_18965 [Chitinophagaceae bacterium]|jgi:hypothetical protein|nr:hypothetical protein [Chitinophagaceae bacterium]